MGRGVFLFFMVVAVSLAIIASPLPLHAAGVVALPRTGQTTCWNTAGEEVNCQTAEGLGQDGDKQAGWHGRVLASPTTATARSRTTLRDSSG
jgi:hypothetical protein